MNRFSLRSALLLGISNTKLLFPLNNIFQQKFNMAAPNNFLNGYNPFSFPPSLNFLGLTSGQQLALATYMRLCHQPYSYQVTIPQGFYSVTQPQPQPNPNPNSFLQPQVSAVTQRTDDKTGRVQNKNQKNQKQGSGPVVIEISDDEGPVQQEKPCEDKSTSATSRLAGFQPVTNIKMVDGPKQQQNLIEKNQCKKLKDKPQVKVTKTKEIYKSSNHKKKSKNEDRQHEVDQKKGPVFSQRIIEKNETKKEPYRLSKKERELLEIGFLREIANEILTGPQFQARLPPFLPHCPTFVSPATTLQSWKKELRASLLERVEKEEE